MITTKQRAQLRGLANSIDAIFQVGKSGLSPAFEKQVDEALEARELIKITVLENSELTAREAAVQLAAAVHADVVQVIGRKFVLYRESREHKEIVLRP